MVRTCQSGPQHTMHIVTFNRILPGEYDPSASFSGGGYGGPEGTMAAFDGEGSGHNFVSVWC